jgi:hypothetical protein
MAKFQPVCARELGHGEFAAFRFRLNFANFMPFCGG